MGFSKGNDKGVLKIPHKWLHSQYLRDLKDVMAQMLMRHFLGYATQYYGTTVITRGTMINIDEFLKNSYLRKPIKTREKRLNVGLNKLIKAKIIEEFRIENNHICVTFTKKFIKEIYPEMPEVR